MAVGATGATAASLITGANVKDNSLTGADIKNIGSVDIKDGSINLHDLDGDVIKAIAKAGLAGPKGDTGARGDKGDKGNTGDTGAKGDKGDKGNTGDTGADGHNASISSGNWGVQSRNVIGSPDIDLRGGPGDAPFGSGSLMFLVDPGSGDTTEKEKAAYGNEQDFTGDLVSNLSEVGFRVWTSGENNALGNPNMPSITFEVDPNLSSTAQQLLVARVRAQQLGFQHLVAVHRCDEYRVGLLVHDRRCRHRDRLQPDDHVLARPGQDRTRRRRR